jgi:hypothetical protein
MAGNKVTGRGSKALLLLCSLLAPIAWPSAHIHSSIAAAGEGQSCMNHDTLWPAGCSMQEP